MGSDKALVQLGEQSLLERSAQTLSAQVSATFISANQLTNTPDTLAKSFPIIADQHSPPRGPLEGVLAVMKHIQQIQTDTAWLVSNPVDCPFIPLDLVQQLLEEAMRSGSEACVATYQNRLITFAHSGHLNSQIS